MKISLKQRWRNIKKLPGWIYFFPAVLLRLLLKTFYRVKLADPYNLCDDPRRLVCMAWHNRLLFLPALFPARLRKRCFAVVSASRDGQYLSDFLKYFSVRTLRGSSRRGGANALLGAINAIQKDSVVFFTPDGPRGPIYKIKKGPVMLASKTQSKIVPLAINASKCWHLKSWDKFQIPKPGATLTLIIGEPMDIPPDLTPEELENMRIKAEKALLDITCDPDK